MAAPQLPKIKLQPQRREVRTAKPRKRKMLLLHLRKPRKRKRRKLLLVKLAKAKSRKSA